MRPTGRRLVRLSLAALGVVYGDIGTSPLYAFRECFNPEYGLAPTLMLGCLLLVVGFRSSSALAAASGGGPLSPGGAALDAGPAAVRVFLWSEAVGEACHGVIVPISARISPGALSPGARCDGPTSTSACWPTVLPSGTVALRVSSGRARTL